MQKPWERGGAVVRRAQKSSLAAQVATLSMPGERARSAYGYDSAVHCLALETKGPHVGRGLLLNLCLME